MRPAVWLEDGLLIPSEVGQLEAFRRWARSDDFPERGRIDFLKGTIELDMCPEELQSHGALKSELHAVIQPLVKAANLGQVFIDRGRLSHPQAGLSVEPDILVIARQHLLEGRSRYLQGARPDRLIEVEGAALLVVEIVSDSSAGKDNRRLPPLYAQAGVEELWLADARGTALSFQIFHLQELEYVQAEPDAEGFCLSRVLRHEIRLRREAWEFPNTWTYHVDVRPAAEDAP